jgi:hypothetical protein
MNKSGMLTIKETWDYINKTKKSLADKWMERNDAIFREKVEAENEYRKIIEERAVNETVKSNLLETYKNNLLSKALKAIYITALEAESLTDNGIVLAEDMVNRYIDEQGGATKLMNRNSGKTYFLDMIFNKINETANRQLEEFITGKSEAAKVEKDNEDEEISTKETSFIGRHRSYNSIFERALLEEDDDNNDSDNTEDDSDDDVLADADTGDSDNEEKDNEEKTNDDSKDKEESDEEEKTEEEDSSDEESEKEDDDDLSPELDDEVIDSEKDDPMGDADTSDSDDSSSDEEEDDDEDDDEVVVDDDEDGVDDNDDASEEKDLRDDLSSEEQEETDPTEKTDDEFLKDLDKEEDVKKAVDLIRARVANAEEEFIKRNAEDKKKINDLLGKISDNVKVVKDISVNDTEKSTGDEVVDSDNDNSDEETSTEESVKIAIVKERVGACKRMIHDIRENKNFTIYEKFVRNLSNSIMRDKTVMESYLIEGEMDFASIMESCKIMYAWLETVNTLQLEKVDSEYIKNVLDGIK